jgi:hypothetical protein
LCSKLFSYLKYEAMKAIPVMMIALAFFASPIVRAQQSGQGKYHIKIEKDVDGQKELIDKTFATKDEMDAFLQGIDDPALPAPPQPPVSPRRPDLPANPEKGKRSYKISMVNKDKDGEKVTNEKFGSKKEMKAYLKSRKIEIPEIEEIEGRIDNEKAAYDGEKGKIKKIIIIGNEGELNEDEVSIKGLHGGNGIIITKEITTDDGKQTKVVTIKKFKRKEQPTGETENNSVPKQKIEEAQPVPLASVAGAEQNINGLKVYPNPASKHFFIEFSLQKPSDVNVRITDINGKEVYAETLKSFAGKFTKDIYQPGLAQGTYLMEVTAGGEKQTMKVEMQ